MAEASQASDDSDIGDGPLLQARPHDRWLTTVEDSDIENDDLLETHLKGWGPVTDDPDIENETLLQICLYGRWVPIIEDPTTETTTGLLAL